ncbi:MAG: serine hydrolase domain-containing protein [Gammaproteobacteria bacterium]
MSMYSGAVPGAGLAVLEAGAAVVWRAYGLADLEERVESTPATNYRLASMTKQFTAAAILLLAEDGRLSIDDPVRKWLPGLPESAAAVLIRHLLTHTAGLADFEELIPAGTSMQLHDCDVLTLLEAPRRGYFPPGTKFRYSNSGYVLLALIVARASGSDFATFLRRRIFLPLDMQQSVAFEAGKSTVTQRAFGYSSCGSSWRRTDQNLTSATLGDGGIYSSIQDLAKWDAALYDGRLLHPESLRQAFAPAVGSDDPAVRYGFGWRVNGHALWHSGESIGFRNVIVRYPRRRTTVIILTNRDHPEPYPTALAIAEAF